MKQTIEILHMLATAVLMILTAELLQMARVLLRDRMGGQ